jgi:serine/threonine protein phosphatase PrpC
MAFKSRPGALPGKPIKTNQDSYIVVPKFLGDVKIGFYAVADGHGMYGHNVSRYVKRILPSKISENIHPKKCWTPSSAARTSPTSKWYPRPSNRAI